MGRVTRGTGPILLVGVDTSVAGGRPANYLGMNL